MTATAGTNGATRTRARAKAMNAAVLVIARRSEPAAMGVSGTLLRILRSAPCPVLVTRAGPPADYGRVLAAVDLREVSRRAVATALATTPVSLIRSTPLASLTSTSVTLSRLKHSRYSSLNVGRLHITR